MVERDRAVAKALRDSAKLLDAQGLEVIEGDALAYLKRAGESFDVVFVDPPYASDLAMKSLALLPGRLNPGARVYAESASPLVLPPPWSALREDRAGAVRYALFEHPSP
jgi:16S rRNA (guanine966-N2)-methyltransferase